MRSTVRQGLLTILAACFFGASGMATAAGAGKDCSPIGTWFGVDPETHVVTGWVATVTGQSSSGGPMWLEAVNPGLGLDALFPTVTGATHDHGAWERTGGNTFKYSFMAMATDSDKAIVFIGKSHGTITMLDDCNTERVTLLYSVYLPTDNPFEGQPLFEIDLGVLYGYRFMVP
jgi:hypothetical protein